MGVIIAVTSRVLSAFRYVRLGYFGLQCSHYSLVWGHPAPTPSRYGVTLSLPPRVEILYPPPVVHQTQLTPFYIMFCLFDCIPQYTGCVLLHLYCMQYLVPIAEWFLKTTVKHVVVLPPPWVHVSIASLSKDATHCTYIPGYGF